MEPIFPVAIDYIVDRAFIVLLEDIYIENIFTYKHLFLHTYYFIFSITVEDDNIVNIRTVRNIFIFFQSCSDKAFLTVNI